MRFKGGKSASFLLIKKNTFSGSVFMLLAFFVRPNGDYRLSNFM